MDRIGARAEPLYRFWAEHFARRGYVSLLVDSFGPRGEREICTQAERKVSEARDRPRDAYAALRWLAARSDVDAKRISVMGWSNGASAAMHALWPDAPGREHDGPQFRAAVAFYPGCNYFAGTSYQPIAPLLIQAGAADDWTPAAACERVARRATGKAIEIDVYDGAHHAFDLPGGAVRTRPEVRTRTAPPGVVPRWDPIPRPAPRPLLAPPPTSKPISVFHVEQLGRKGQFP